MPETRKASQQKKASEADDDRYEALLAMPTRKMQKAAVRRGRVGGSSSARETRTSTQAGRWAKEVPQGRR